MTDTILVCMAALGFGVCLTVAILDHTDRDDAARAHLVECVDGWGESAELNRACLAVADECRALVLGGACSCWMPDEVTP